jgi:hypothetical protein
MDNAKNRDSYKNKVRTSQETHYVVAMKTAS